jgi:hypothetical protein
MKRIYSTFRVALMTFALGLAAVYMSNGLSIAWNEVPVKLPTAVSDNVLFVIPDNIWVLTREKNCSKDPRDARARLDCANEELFENRDMTLYAKYEITCDPAKSDHPWSICGYKEMRKERELVWRHWREKRRAHIIVKYLRDTGQSESHDFAEPNDNDVWQLVSKGKQFGNFRIDGENTEVGVILLYNSYQQARWRIAAKDKGPHYMSFGTRFLEFTNENGNTIPF